MSNSELQSLKESHEFIHNLMINWRDFPKYSDEGYQKLCRIETYLRNQIFDAIRNG